MKDIQFYLVFVISFLTLYAVNAQSEKCNPAEPTAKYDYIKVSLLDDKGNPVKDTIVGQILRLRNAFKPCREAMYKAIYKTAENILISQRLISLRPTGKSWKYDSDRQTEIVITYHPAQFQQKNIQRFYPNRAFAKQRIEVPGETTGITENEQEVWMHPFRANEYHFTEVAPFPEVKLPLEKGKFWSSSLNIGHGWGDWAGSSIHSEYTVTGQETLTTPYKSRIPVRRIDAVTEASFGKSNVTYWFNPEIGFVKIMYQNYLKQKLTFELIGMKQYQ